MISDFNDQSETRPRNGDSEPDEAAAQTQPLEEETLPIVDTAGPARFEIGSDAVMSDDLAEMRSEGVISPSPDGEGIGMIDHYRVIKQLGIGGMGIVLLAEDTRTSEHVALKVMRLDCIADSRLRHSFVKEADHMKSIRHQHVLPVTDVVDRREGPYYVMPFIEGGSLAEKAKPGRSVNLDRLLPVLLQVADALSYAHNKHGVIHRDVKPENVLLDPQGRAYLCDFGLVRTMFNDTLQPNFRRMGWTVGTRPYMAPEVVEGNAGDYRVDVYSFGAMMYELVTGYRPYSGSSTEEVFAKIKLGPPLPVRERNPELPEEWATIIDGAMHRELSGRYSEMEDLRKDLQRLSEGKPPLGPAQHAAAPQRKKAAKGATPNRPTEPSGSGVLAKLIVVVVVLGLVAGGVIVLPGLLDDPSNAEAAGRDGSNDDPPTLPTPPTDLTRTELLEKLRAAIAAQDLVAVETYAEELGRIEPAEIALIEQNWPLIDAARFGNLQVFRVLAYAGNTVVTVTDNRGYQALHVAAETGQTEIIDYLLTPRGERSEPLVGVDAKTQGASLTALHIAVENDQPEVIRMLARFGANPNVRANDKSSPLHLAVNSQSLSVTRTLIESFSSESYDGDPIDMDIAGKLDQTPLHIAAGVRNNAGLIELLIEHGASIDRTDAEGKTPLDLNNENVAGNEAALSAGG